MARFPAAVQAESGEPVEAHHGDDVAGERKGILVLRQAVQFHVNKRRLAQKHNHGRERSGLIKQKAQGGAVAEHVAVTRADVQQLRFGDGFGGFELRQEAVQQEHDQRGIGKQEGKNAAPARQTVQQRAEQRRDERCRHHDNADEGEHFCGFAALVIVAHHRARHHRAHTRAQCLHHTPHQQLVGRLHKHQRGTGQHIYRQAAQGDIAPPFNVGQRAAD